MRSLEVYSHLQELLGPVMVLYSRVKGVENMDLEAYLMSLVECIILIPNAPKSASGINKPMLKIYVNCIRLLDNHQDS